jgi:hypothetical protein
MAARLMTSGVLLDLLESTATVASSGVRDLVEFEATARSKVDRDATTGEIVIRRVKILGERSSNLNPDGTRNRYPLDARKKAVPLYEGVSVFLNHPDRSTPGRERGYDEKLGSLHGVEALTEGNFGDLHLNPKHPRAEQIAWDAEHKPGRLGLSHNAQGRGRAQGGDYLVEEIVHVRSVDLVGAGATTRGLFESRQEQTVKIDREKLKQLREADLTGVLDVLQGQGTEAEKITKVLDLLKVMSEAPAPAATTTATEGQREPLVTVINAPGTGELQESALQKKVADLEAKLAAGERRAKREKELRESQLAKDDLSEVFLESFYAAEDDKRATALLEDRKKVVFSRRPVSAAPGGGGREIKDVGKFMRGED